MKRTNSLNEFTAYEMNKTAKLHNERAPQRRLEFALESIQRGASKGIFFAKFGLNQICPYTSKKLEELGYKLEQNVEPDDDGNHNATIDIITVRW